MLPIRMTLLSGLVAFAACATPEMSLVLPKTAIQSPRALGELEVIHKDKTFFVNNEEIPSYKMDSNLRGISTNKLAQMIAAGSYVRINQSSDGKYTADLNQRLNGGGIIIGKAAHWIIKIGGYAGYGILCIIHPAHIAEANEVKAAIDAVSEVAEAVGNIVPGP